MTTKKKEHLNVYIDEALFELIRQMAKEQERSISWVSLDLIKKGLYYEAQKRLQG
jgi:hypothetical protein